MGIFLFTLTVVMISLGIIGFIKHTFSPDVFGLILLLCLIQPVTALLLGLFILFIEIPRAHRERVVVCKQGLFQAGKDIKSRRVEIVEWVHIRRIYKGVFGQGYSLIRWSGEALPLSFYQDAEGLVDLIKALSKVEEK
jgi:hypothetical protein